MRSTAIAFLIVLFAMMIFMIVGCDMFDSMNDYPPSHDATDRSDTLKTGAGTYGGTNSAYNNAAPVSQSGSTSNVVAPATATYGGSNAGGSNAGNTTAPGVSAPGPDTQGR